MTIPADTPDPSFATLDYWSGKAYPIGASYDGVGTNFSVFSEFAERVELCLFNPDGTEVRIPIEDVMGHLWHVYVPGAHPGQHYGYRAYGPWDPANGLRFNPHKLLLDPYARAIHGDYTYGQAVFGYTFGNEDEMNTLDSAPHVPKSVVVNPYFDWAGDRQLGYAMRDTIIYEMNVKGFSQLNKSIPPELRGSYAGLACPPAIEYLTKLGITAVELLPVHQFITPQHLDDQGLRNYWGYDTVGYFAPHQGYGARRQWLNPVQEFKMMVKSLHAAGIEVILDVVYNHTAEGNHLGPTLSLRGLDNANYYRLVEGNRRYYMDYTGTGNSMNAQSPFVLQMIMDSLRYWIQEMHVDGFRFDLASTLARELHDVDKLSSFFDIIQQDPVISQVKLIAEPWDIGEGGYQVGNFPPVWSEWNGRYRDTVRDFWRGEPAALGEFAKRFTGSADLYQSATRRPSASINFMTAHDGFTLADLVSYNTKHNDANGEHNQDGTNDNRSWNCGVEGPTNDPEIVRLRTRQQRNFLATLLLSQGVPMLCGGDEMGRTQGGNNNAYAQDNEISWYDWEHCDHELLDFTTQLIAFRKAHPTFSRRRWFKGEAVSQSSLRDIEWYTLGGEPMTEQDWDSGFARTVSVFLNGKGVARPTQFTPPEDDDDVLIMFNAHSEHMDAVIPSALSHQGWKLVLDTDMGWITRPMVLAKMTTTLTARSMQVWVRDKSKE